MEGYTERCVISFIDLYKKTERNTEGLNILPTTIESINNISKKFSKIAQEHNICVETCSEAYDLTEFGIKKGKCIDDNVISRIIGYELNVKKDDTQREVCGCVKSIDIGQYNTCMHHCLYCYANFNYNQVEDNFKLHDNNYPLLIGKVRENAKITVRPMKSIKGKKLGQEQLNMLDIL